MPASKPYFNRDLSWLSFNFRVLMEAQDERLPLYERIKFLAIYSSNMGEFFRVRVASIQEVARVQREFPDDEAFDEHPDKLLQAIFSEVHRQQEVFGSIFFRSIIPQLKKHNINLILGEPTYLDHVEFVKEIFEEEIKAYLHPELLRKNKIQHFLRDGALYLAIKLRNRPRDYDQLLPAEKLILADKKRIRYALVQIPTHYFSRFVKLPQLGDTHCYMFLDDVIRYNLKEIFHGYDILSCHSIKLNRNADLMIEDEYEGNLVDKVQRNLTRRKVGDPARFLYDLTMPASMLKYLRDTFGIKKRESVPGGTYHSYSDFFGFPNPLSPALERKPLPPLPKEEIKAHEDIFAAMRRRNWLLHFPYHTFDHVISFLNQAAADPAVKAIYATQYRVASDSQVVSALARAARNGKEVMVFVEIKARFDEASNLRSAQEMDEAGVKIRYSIPGLKVHAKVALAIREEENGEERGYAYLSTGNFNEKTARIYTDHGYLTSDREVIHELVELFKHLNDRKYLPPPFKKLLVAQFGMRERFLELIQREIDHKKAGKSAHILIKLNNLEDRPMIDKLYAASRAGVKIDLIIRGICCLRPGVAGMSENITVKRIVDQFLEHARVFVFNNAGNPDMYLGSADWMKRNLSRRIEVIYPVEDADLLAEVQAILDIQWKDTAKAVLLNQDLQNVSIAPDAHAIRAQLEIYRQIEAHTIGSSTQTT